MENPSTDVVTSSALTIEPLSTTDLSTTVPADTVSTTSYPTTDIPNLITDSASTASDNPTPLTMETPSTDPLTSSAFTMEPLSTTDLSTTDSTDTASTTSYPTTDISNFITDSTPLTMETPSTDAFTSSGQTTGPLSTSAVTHRGCTVREGTSFTVLADKYLNSLGFSFYLEIVVNLLSLRFPCVTRQYTSVTLDNADTNETITTEKGYFLQSIKGNYRDSQADVQMLPCNQSLLYGLKRALEISPAESVITVFTSGSMIDYNDPQLLSEVYTLLEEKKSQVYVMLYTGNCSVSASEEEIFNNISSISFGEFLAVNDYNYYQLVTSLELLLSKPLNSSVNILDIKLNVTNQYIQEFNVTTSLSYLLITRDDKFALNITDPNENTITLEENPYNKQNYSNLYKNAFISSHLVKGPAVGSWTLKAWGNGLLIVQVLGFTGLNTSGNCSDCHPNASCEEFGGDQQCTCKVGFAGDGTYCDDINECQDRYTNICDFYGGGSCVNTIGSYTCNCNPGFQYNEAFGCVDIDECAESSLNDCHPLAVCTNGYGSYTCTCPSDYYKNELNSCIDPCSNHTILNDTWRSISNNHTEQDYWNSTDWIHCDDNLYGWYRFKGEYDLHIPEYCIPFYSCGTHAPMWITSPHPTVSDGIVSRKACANWWYGESCCTWSNQIAVKLCPEGFYVYNLQGTPTCWLAYCTVSGNETNTTAEPSTTNFDTTSQTPYSTTSDITTGPTVRTTSTNTFPVSDLTTGLSSTTGVTDRQCIVKESDFSSVVTQCFPDEECMTVDGVTGCHCSPSLKNTSTEYARPEDINIECGMTQITISYSKCYIELLGFNTSSLQLKDRNCTGVIEIRDRKYITVTTLPRSGYCGAELIASGDYLTYMNVAYLSTMFSSFTFSTNISCTYRRSMENLLWLSTSVLVSESNLSLEGSSSYTVRMGVFQDSNYTILYEDPGTWIDTNVSLYTGISVENNTSSTAVLLIKSCHVTTASDTDTAIYRVISDYCPVMNDSTLYVGENGVSLQGRFSLIISEFAGNYSRMYIDCQVHLCNTTLEMCSPNCSQTNPGIMDNGVDITNLTVGPLFLKGKMYLFFFYRFVCIFLPSTKRKCIQNKISQNLCFYFLYIFLLYTIYIIMYVTKHTDW
ncbi:uromodulin-like [Rana temporaria]|uniref:uromodulin-like n=1 Tax=Rana temporaria TaxID=8407 RepID=UPI001AAD47CA|nr:uromodulin-like [Rana temporaria]